METQQDDGKTFNDYVLYATRASQEAMARRGGELIKQNLADYQQIKVAVTNLTEQIQFKQSIAQSYLQKAIADFGVDSKSTQLLIRAAEQQTKLVAELQDIKSELLADADLGIKSDLLSGQNLKLLGEFSGTLLDTGMIYKNLSEQNYAGSLSAGASMFSGTLFANLLTAGVIVLGAPITPVAAILIGGLSVFGAAKLEDFLNESGFSQEVIDYLSNPGYESVALGCRISEKVWNYFNDAQNWRPYVPVDPLALDLDNDGIETTAINGWNGVLFDHNNDGVKTATGWLKGDDGFLVLDRNGNGTIDNGGELFGDNTKLGNGVNATDGFAALADVDTNYDHLIDSNDGIFPLLKVWQDLNQDGISQANESVIFYKNRLINLTSSV